MFSQKKIWLYFLVLSLFTTISHAQRDKTLDEYFEDVEKSAKKVGYALDGIKDYMDEAYKPDSFVKKTFFELNPKWYMRTTGSTSYSNSDFHIFTFTTIKTIRTRLQRDRVTERELRGITLVHRGRELYNENLKFYIIKPPVNRALFKDIPKKNLNLAFSDYSKYKNKINTLLRKNFYLKLKKLYENVELNDPYNKNLKKMAISIFPKDNEYIQSVKKYGSITLNIYTHKTFFKIKATSKHELYDKGQKLLAIFDEYIDTGIAKKTIKHKGRYDESVEYVSLASTGKYRSMLTYSSKQNFGTWSTSIGNSNNDLTKKMKSLKKSYKELSDISEKYYMSVIDEIVKKYTDKSNTNNGFGNEL